jgi:uncharacterized membrane protein YgdD (TMEM256/DUF423 family)
MFNRLLLPFSCFLMALYIALQAAGAHAIKGVLEQPYLHSYQVATTYIALGAFSLLLSEILRKLGLIKQVRPSWLFVLATVIFSGSLFIYAFSEISLFSKLTPVGGLLFISTWLYLAVQQIKQ